MSLSLATTANTLALCNANPSLAARRRSIGDAVETGELYSQGFALSDPQAIADDLPRFEGRRSSSPTPCAARRPTSSRPDFRTTTWVRCSEPRATRAPAAQTSGPTSCCGCGWTTRWRSLPRAGFRVALRRATRAGINVGVALEDLGVAADAVHLLTRRDITERNQDLLAAAADLLAAGYSSGPGAR